MVASAVAYIRPWHITAIPSVLYFRSCRRRRPTRADTRSQRSGSGSRWNKSCSCMFDTQLSPLRWSLRFDSAFAAFVPNQQKCLKVKGDWSTSPAHHLTSSPPPALPPDEFKAPARIIYFLSFSSLYMVESAHINSAYEVSRRGGRRRRWRAGERKKPKACRYCISKVLFEDSECSFCSN